MDKKILLEKLIKYLDKDAQIPESLEEMKDLWKRLVLELDNYDIPRDILDTEDKFLRLELLNQKLTDGEKYGTINYNYRHGDKIALREGDITSIYGDVIVNPINKDFNFKDNDLFKHIVLQSGLRLRKKCKESFDISELSTSEVLITRAYNMLSDFLIHVVVPVVEDEVTEDNKVELKMSYFNVLECANNNMAKIVVLPILGYVDNKFPLEDAVRIAVKEVVYYLDKPNCTLEKVIFNVSTDEEYEMYLKVLDEYKNKN